MKLVLCASVLVTGLVGCALPGPEVVLSQAVEAARDGDREAYLECFTERSRPILETWWRAVDAHNPPVGVLGAAPVHLLSVGVEQGRDFGPERAILTITEGADKTTLVAHHLGGMWRIDLLDSQSVAPAERD